MFITSEKESLPMQLPRKHFKYSAERLRVPLLCGTQKQRNLFFGDFARAFQLFHEQVHFSVRPRTYRAVPAFFPSSRKCLPGFSRKIITSSKSRNCSVDFS